jgi:hypothetical protein
MDRIRDTESCKKVKEKGYSANPPVFEKMYWKKTFLRNWKFEEFEKTVFQRGGFVGGKISAGKGAYQWRKTSKEESERSDVPRRQSFT